MKTISRRATRQIADLKERLTDCQVLSLRHDFKRTPCDPAWAWAELYKYHQARLSVNAAGTIWTIHIHGNLWYELREPAPAKEA
jgi:hypothetical protein